MRWDFLLGMLGGTIGLLAQGAIAQVVSDGSIGTIVTPNGMTYEITGGTTVGQNLFHSFDLFNIPTGGVANFQNNPNLVNLFSRVTGGSPAEIDGVIRSRGTTNFFLLSPAGILFGPNSSLDVGGSFVATTANAIEFGDLGSFSATNPAAPSELLTINPSAFLFSAITPQKLGIVVQSNTANSLGGNGLQVPNGQILLLLGGDVTVDGAALNSWGGRIELGAVSGNGIVGLSTSGDVSFPTSLERANIVFTNGSMADVALDDGGDIAIIAHNISLAEGSDLFAGIDSGFGSSNSQAGNITLDATGDIRLSGRNTSVSNDVPRSSIGNGGDITVRSRTLSLEDGAVFRARVTGRGNGGNVTIDTNQMSLRDGSYISVSTWFGKGGTLQVNAADSIDLVGVTPNADFPTSSLLAQNLNSVDSPKIVIQTKRLTVQDGAGISVATVGEGRGADLTINATESIDLIGVSRFNPAIPSLLLASTSGLLTNNPAGNGGNLTIQTGRLTIRNGAQIEASTFGEGNAGNIKINATESIRLIGESSEGSSRIFSNSISAFGIRPENVGNAGNLNFKTGSFILEDGARISAATETGGKGGTIDITSDQLILQNSSAITTSTSNSADAGNIIVNTNRLALKGGSFITGDSFSDSSGKTGNLTINAAESVEIIGTSSDLDASGLYAQTRGSGRGGNLQVSTGRLTILDGGTISTETSGSGQGGNLFVNAGSIEIAGGSLDQSFSSSINAGAETGSSGSSGDIVITTGRLTARDGGFVSSTARANSTGNAGNIIINATDLIELAGRTVDSDNSSGISAAAAQGSSGNAGSVNISTQRLIIKDGAAVLAQGFGSGQAGGIQIQATDSVKVIGGRDDSRSKINASVGFFATGKPSNIRIDTQRLELLDGGALLTSTFGNVDAGDIQIKANESVTISGDSSALPLGVGIEAASFSGIFLDSIGQGGNIEIQTGRLNLTENGRISALAFGQGNAGNIKIAVNGLLSATGSSISTASEQASGGAISITAGRIRLLGDSDITTAVSNGAGGGGDIVLAARSIVALNDSDILAFAREGSGGNVSLNTRAFFGQNYRPAPRGTDPATLDGNDRVDINASGSLSSGIITRPDTSFIQNSLNQLPNNQIDTNQLLAQTCIIRQDQPEGTFYITGTGGIPNRPNDPALSAYPTNTIQPTTQTAQKPWKLGDPIVEPQGFYKLADGRFVMSRECTK